MKKKILAIIMMITVMMGQSLQVKGEIFSYSSQLTTEEKTIFDEIYKYFYIDKKTDSLYLNVNNISHQYKCDILQSNYINEAKIAFSAVINDHPELYWARTVTINTSGRDTYNNEVFVKSELEGATVQINGTTPHSGKDIKKFNKAVKKAIKKINKYTGKNPSRATRIRAINKWLCKNTKYNMKHGDSTDEKYQYLHNAYGVFVKKQAVCDGYAKALKLLCDYYKIPCMINLGHAYNNSGQLQKHVWNLVRVKKKWYVVDATWNDTNHRNKWTLCGTKQIKKTHFNERERLDVLGSGYFKLPKISKKSYKK